MNKIKYLFLVVIFIAGFLLRLHPCFLSKSRQLGEVAATVVVCASLLSVGGLRLFLSFDTRAIRTKTVSLCSRTSA